MSDCNLCQFGDKCKTNKMSGRGPENAPIMIVLDAPDWVDDKAGTPAEGDGGSKLWYLLNQAGIKRSEVFITYAVKCKPTMKSAEVKPKEIKSCRIHLLGEIKKHKSKVIVTMGKLGFQSLTEEKSVGDFRGHFSDFEMGYNVTVGDQTKKKSLTAKIMPTFSPYAALSKWEYDDYIIHDLKKSKNYAETLIVPMTPTPTYTTILSLKQLEEFHKTYMDAKFFTHDFETTSLDFSVGEVINSGYCASLDVAHIMYFLRKWPIAHQKKFSAEQKQRVEQILEFTNSHHKKIMEVVKEVHANDAVKCGHNHKFDRKYARKAGVPFRNSKWDTVIMGGLIDENKMHDLNSEMEYRGINYGAYDTKLWPYVNKDPKKKKAYTHAPPDILDLYLAIDACGDYRLYKKMKKELEAEGFLDMYRNQQRPLNDALYDMEYHGFKMNTELMKSDAKKLDGQIDTIVTKLKTISKDAEFNPNSPEQLSRLMEEMNYPFEKLDIKHGKKGYSTGEDALTKFLKFKKWKEIPELVLEMRGLGKLKNTYIVNKAGTKGMLPKVDKNGFLHTGFNVHSARTGRLTSQNPNCLSLDTEILTVNGWKDYKNIKIGDSVLNLNLTTKQVERDIVQDYYLSEEKDQKMVNFSGVHINQTMTQNHRFIGRKRSKKLIEFNASEFNPFTAPEIVQSARMLRGGVVNSHWLKLHVAFQADGSFSNKNRNYITFNFKRKRKVDRLNSILADCGIGPSVTVGNDRTIFYIKSKLIPDWVLSKKFGYELLDLSIECRTLFLEELRYWDGELDKKNIIYDNTCKYSMDVIQAVACITGYRCKISSRKDIIPDHYKQMHRALITNRDFSRTEFISKKLLTQKTSVWCVKTNNSTIITRTNGNVLITGNCQNIPNPSHGVNIRNYFIAPHEDWCTWEADYSALELRVVAHLADDKVMIKQLQDDLDMHSFNAVRFGHVLGFVPKDIDYEAFRKNLKYSPPDKWEELPEQQKADVLKNINKAKEFKKLRNLSKSVAFGLNYGIEARTLAEDNDVPLEDVEVIIELYFDAYKGLARWRQEQIAIATNEGVSILPWTGRKRRVTQFTRWITSKYSQEIRKRDFDIAEVGRQLMNFPVQGFANEIFTKGKLRVIKRMKKEKLKSSIRISIHDGVVGIGPKSEMLRVKQICHEEMTTQLGEGTKKLTLGVEFNCNLFWYGPELDPEKLAS